jgi:D-alanyl-lipoteichoic acid acyltransferase DltB (MBOAT superfamily)
VLFPTITFATFFMVVWPITWAVARWPVARQVVLLAASCAFYAYWDERYLALLAALVVLNFGSAHAVARAASRPAVQRPLVWASVGAHLAILGWFKYYGFFATSLTSALDRVGVVVQPPLVQIVLPLGISFVTFQAISHILEVRRGNIPPGGLLEVATWLTFFPTIVSGPITRPSELLPQLREVPDRRIEANRALTLIARGLFKKMVLASYLATAIVDDVFAVPAQHSGAEVVVGVYAYAAQLYLDFSGYTDMAIGLALLLGLRLPPNFDRPYVSQTVTEFWTRWHMTLTRWLRDFVFTPLTLRSRRTTVATCRNLLLVMLIAGLWHGAAWTFVAFGAIHGSAMAVERAHREHRRRLGRPPLAEGRAHRLVRRLVTFNVVCLGWVFFRAESLESAVAVLQAIGNGWDPTGVVTVLLLGVLAGVLVAQSLPAVVRDRTTSIVAALPAVALSALLAVALLATDVFGPVGVPPFLYGGF